jgi:hypothetical protein
MLFKRDLWPRLARLDRHSDDGPWTRQVLRLIAEHPAERVADLAAAGSRCGDRRSSNGYEGPGGGDRTSDS